MKYFFLFILTFFISFKAFSNESNYNFLIASPKIADSRFKESVILLFYHNKFGASGLAINKEEKKITIKDLFDSAKIPLPKGFINNQLSIFWGGPINSHHLFFIHSTDYKNENSIIFNENFIVTRSSDVLYDIAKNKGPKDFIIIKGFSIWSPDQLDEELKRGTWEKKINYYFKIFDNYENMWQTLINSQGA